LVETVEFIVPLGLFGTVVVIMHRSFIVSLLSTLAVATPLFAPIPQQQQSLTHKKPLVESEALQDDITANALLARAKQLFEIAETSEKDYGHPTRVIGSAGKAMNYYTTDCSI